MRSLNLVPALTLALSGCVSSPPARPPAPMAGLQPGTPADEILWARKDGLRMSGNPALFEQGTQDKQRCAAEASLSGALNFPQFAACMDAAGYVQMRRRG